MNADQDIFQRISQRYGAKLDVSAEQSLVRITADRFTSGDMLKFLIYMLNRVQYRAIEIPQVTHLKDRDIKVMTLGERLRSSVFREQLQQVTNTIIEPEARIRRSDEVVKVCLLMSTSLYRVILSINR